MVAVRTRDRPPEDVKRPMVSMRIDPDVLAAMRASGKGWQTRVNVVSRQAVELGRVGQYSIGADTGAQTAQCLRCAWFAVYCPHREQTGELKTEKLGKAGLPVALFFYR